MVDVRHSNSLWTIPSLIAVMVLSVSAQAQYGGGSGTSDDPHRIATAADLIALGESPDDWGKHFKLVADVDLDGVQYDRAVIAWDVDGFNIGFDGTEFTGTFDGGGHQIANLTIDTGAVERGHDFLGFFGCIGEGAVIKDLQIAEVSIRGGTNSDYIGGVVGNGYSAAIENCHVAGTITSRLNSQYIGGVVGYFSASAIKDSETACTITAGDDSSYRRHGWLPSRRDGIGLPRIGLYRWRHAVRLRGWLDWHGCRYNNRRVFCKRFSSRRLRLALDRWVAWARIGRLAGAVWLDRHRLRRIALSQPGRTGRKPSGRHPHRLSLGRLGGRWVSSVGYRRSGRQDRRDDCE